MRGSVSRKGGEQVTLPPASAQGLRVVVRSRVEGLPGSDDREVRAPIHFALGSVQPAPTPVLLSGPLWALTLTPLPALCPRVLLAAAVHLSLVTGLVPGAQVAKTRA